MATKNFRSTLLEPTSEFAHGDKLRFTALATVGEVLKGSFSETTIGADGVYSVDLQYGKHRIDYKPYEGVWRHFADVEVNADTLATTLQDLALASVPVTDETILTLQGILADAEAAKEAAETAEEASEAALASIDSKIEEVELGYPALLYAQMRKTVYVDEINGDDSTGSPYKTLYGAINSAVIGSELIINCLSDITYLVSADSSVRGMIDIKHNIKVSVILQGHTLFITTALQEGKVAVREQIDASKGSIGIYSGDIQVDYGDPSHESLTYTAIISESSFILTGEKLSLLRSVNVVGNAANVFLFALDGYSNIEGNAQISLCSVTGAGRVKIAGNRGVTIDDLRVVYRDSSVESGWTDR